MRAALIVMAVAICSPANAIEGVFRNRIQTITIVHASGRDYLVDMQTSNERGCGGRVKGIATQRGPVMVFRSQDRELSTCVATITARGDVLRVNEEQGCTDHHGAACGFTGTMRKR